VAKAKTEKDAAEQEASVAAERKSREEGEAREQKKERAAEAREQEKMRQREERDAELQARIDAINAAAEGKVIFQSKHSSGLRIELYEAKAEKHQDGGSDEPLIYYYHDYAIFNDTGNRFDFVTVKLSSPDGEPCEALLGSLYRETKFTFNTLGGASPLGSKTKLGSKPYKFNKAEISSIGIIRGDPLSQSSQTSRAKAEIQSMQASRKDISYKPKVVFALYPGIVDKQSIHVDNLLAFAQAPGGHGWLLDPNVKHVKLSGIGTHPEFTSALKGSLSNHKAAYLRGADFPECANYFNTLVILSEVAPNDFARAGGKQHLNEVLANIKRRFKR